MSDSSGFSSSTSTPVLLNNPQTDLTTQISAYAWQQAQQVFDLANQAYSRLQGYTNQVIPSLISNANTASQAASGLWNRYQSTFEPLENQLISEANSYAGAGRVSAEMGAAEAAQQQGGAQAREQAEQQLGSFGIDPSSGRYADLDRVSRLQTAAAATGAGRQARLDTEAIGRQLRGQAIQVGQQLPGQTANFLNSGVGALATAANAANAEGNTRANLLNVPNNYLATAMGLRPPPTGQNSFSTSQQHSSSGGGNSGNKNQGAGGGRGGNDGGGGGQGGDVGRAYGPTQTNGPGGGTNPYYQGGQPNAGIINVNGGEGPGGSPWETWDPGISDQWTQGGVDAPFWQGGATDPFSSDYGGFNDPYSGGADGGYSDYNYSQIDPGLQFDQGGNGFGQAPSDWADYGNQGSADSSVWGDNSGYTDTSSGGGGDYSGDYGWGDAGYATGGDVNGAGASQGIPTPGGMVPSSASPSGGAQQDDVNAQLTPHEFVVPQDVALWKGQEFFQNLIKKSREARMGAPAKGKPAQRSPGPATFRSR